MGCFCLFVWGREFFFFLKKLTIHINKPREKRKDEF